MKDKKIGAEGGDPNLHSQPRLPGSVVGEASMQQVGGGGKITEGHCPRVTRGDIGEIERGLVTVGVGRRGAPAGMPGGGAGVTATSRSPANA